MTTAFVLGGGGLLGAHEVGMLRALGEAGIRPDQVVGTSPGALNGVLVAAEPAGAAGRLAQMWQGEELRLAFSEKLWGRAARLVRSGTHLHSLEPLRRVLARALPGASLADLELPFQCVAASIEGATARWFTCCRPAGTGPRRACRSSATRTGPGWGSASSAPTPRPRATWPRWPLTDPIRRAAT